MYECRWTHRPGNTQHLQLVVQYQQQRLDGFCDSDQHSHSASDFGADQQHFVTECWPVRNRQPVRCFPVCAGDCLARSREPGQPSQEARSLRRSSRPWRADDQRSGLRRRNYESAAGEQQNSDRNLLRDCQRHGFQRKYTVDNYGGLYGNRRRITVPPASQPDIWRGRLSER